MRKILAQLLIISSISISAFGLTRAFFSDTESSTGNVLAAGSIDLLIDNSSYYNGQVSPDTTWSLDNLPGHLFFNFTDLKPSDWGEDTISLHVQNDAWSCMKITLTKNDDITCTTPELLDDPTCAEPDTDSFDGELGSLVNFVFWADDGDNVFEINETIFKSGSASILLDGSIWPLADSGSSIWSTPGPIPAEVTRYIGKYWCFGTLIQSPVTPGDNSPLINSGFTCNGSSLTNASQSDSILADVEFTAIQARNNPDYKCVLTVPTPTFTPTPTPLACIETFANSAEQANQGTNKNGTPVLASRSNSNFALGAPQSTGAAFDSPVVANSFFSLGFKLSQPEGGSLVLKFLNPFFDQPGADLQIFEITGVTNPPYPEEKIKVEVSSNGSTWTTVSASLTKDGTVDISPVPSAQYVRLTDLSNIALFEATADGYDLDAVKAFCGTN